MEPSRDYTASASAPPETASSRAGAGGNGHDTAASSRPPAEAFKYAAARLGEAREYVTYFLGAKVDGIKLTLRNVAIYAVLGIVAGVVGVGMLITAAALLLTGLAGAIGAMFNPDRPWAGALIVGFLVLVATFAGIILLMKKLTGASRKRTIQKYEDRKRDERNTYGHDVQERAREHAQQKQQR